MSYKLIDGSDCILDTVRNLNIPSDPNNRHFQEYISWLSEGNCPEPADKKNSVADYSKFWDSFLESNAYNKSILPSSRKRVSANMSFTIFLSSINDAKIGFINIDHIQNSLNQVVTDCNLTIVDRKEILDIIKSNSIPLNLNTGESK